MSKLIIKLYALFFDFALFVRITTQKHVVGVDYILSRTVRVRKWQRCTSIERSSFRFIKPPSYAFMIDHNVSISLIDINIEAR